MNNLLKLVVFTLLSGPVALTAVAAQDHQGHGMPAAQTAATNPVSEKVITTKGEIKIIDLDNKKITVAHEPIPSINWPAMTMRFTFDDPAQISGLKVGDKIDLDFVQQGNISLLKKIALTR